MVAIEKILKIYCLMRAADENYAWRRIEKALKNHQLNLTTVERTKIVPLTYSYVQPNLGLADDIYQEQMNSLTIILHVAWPVNFNLALESFEKQLQGLQALIQLALNVNTHKPARIYFVSSVSSTSCLPCLSRVTTRPMLRKF
jgi:thioester reductase-like protein